MSISLIFSLLGGLSFFLYGMHLMSQGLEEAAGDRLKEILEKLTANRFVGVIVGAIITAVIQSSSATTVMVVGFVNSNMMTLSQAIWIIMGANIGTTITGQLVALDLGMIAPLLAFIGVVMITFVKNKKAHHYGAIIAGFGMLFVGMEMMGNSMEPLKTSPEFVGLMTSFSNPLLAILAGTIFTAIIQSSSASVGIFQTLAKTGLLAYENAVFMVFGANIGTCVTALLASLGTSIDAKRSTVLHFAFNIFGMLVFTILCLTTPAIAWVGNLTPGLPASQIANMNTIFKVTTTLILLPFGEMMVKATYKIIKDKEENHEENFSFGNYSLGQSAVALDFVTTEVNKMIKATRKNVSMSIDAIINGDISKLDKIKEREDKIDKYNQNISRYVSQAMANDSINDHNLYALQMYFMILSDIERIGDHAYNMAKKAVQMQNENITFSSSSLEELKSLEEIALKQLDLLTDEYDDLTEWLSKEANLEQKIDDLARTYRETHLERINQGICNEQASLIYIPILMDFERIGDHVLNVAQAITKAQLVK